MESNKTQSVSRAIQVADKVSAMLAYWDHDLVCRFANAAYLEWFGKSKEEMIDKMRISELLGQSIFEKNLPYILGALGGKTQTFEREIPSPQGGIRYSIANYFPDVVDGEVMGFIVHVADVTPIKLLEKNLADSNRIIAEQNKNLRTDNEIITRRTNELKSAYDDIATINEELRAANEELSSMNEQLHLANTAIEAQAVELRQYVQKEKELMEIKNRFISVASHEFRTPLSIILLSSEFLHRFWDRCTQVQIDAKLKTIKRHVDFMNELLNDILEIRKFEERKLKVNRKPVDLSSLKELAQEIFQASSVKNQLNFQLNRTETTILTDERLLHTILMNLVSNAAKYSPNATPVDVRVEGGTDQLVIVVKDSGLGIPPEEMKNLFTSFHRANNVGEIRGTGLGLTIVKRAVEFLNGEIDVVSQLAKGTSFTVTIPLNNPDDIVSSVYYLA